MTKLSPSKFQDYLNSSGSDSSSNPVIAKFKEACKQFDTDLIENGRPSPVNFTLPKVQSAQGAESEMNYEQLVGVMRRTLEIARYDLVEGVKSKMKEMGKDELTNA